MARGDITSASIGIAPSLPDDNPDGGIFYLLLGSYSITHEQLSLTSEDVGSQSFELCGGVEPLWGPS